MIWDHYEFRIGSHYLPALINDDWTGLNTDEMDKLQAFLDRAPKAYGHWAQPIEDDEGRFRPDRLKFLCAISALIISWVRIL